MHYKEQVVRIVPDEYVCKRTLHICLISTMCVFFFCSRSSCSIMCEARVMILDMSIVNEIIN